jgi:hypothetical protein
VGVWDRSNEYCTGPRTCLGRRYTPSVTNVSLNHVQSCTVGFTRTIRIHSFLTFVGKRRGRLVSPWHATRRVCAYATMLYAGISGVGHYFPVCPRTWVPNVSRCRGARESSLSPQYASARRTTPHTPTPRPRYAPPLPAPRNNGTTAGRLRRTLGVAINGLCSGRPLTLGLVSVA